MTGILTPETATITTATIAVKTLTLSKRQVTLSVFRQLPECHWDSVVSLGYLLGYHDEPIPEEVVTWGIVRYYWGQYDAPRLHHRYDNYWVEDAYHVVVQFDDILWRMFATMRGPEYDPRRGVWQSGYWVHQRWGYPADGVFDDGAVRKWREFISGQFGGLDQLFIAV